MLGFFVGGSARAFAPPPAQALLCFCAKKTVSGGRVGCGIVHNDALLCAHRLVCDWHHHTIRRRE